MQDIKEPGMVFVCGCGHSGTSLITAMLGSHKDIYAINEETGIFAKPGQSDDQIRSVFSNKYGPYVKEKGARFLCEKTPVHIRHLARLRSIFPSALIVIPVRDVRDVALSIKLRFGDLKKGYVRWIRDNTFVQMERQECSRDTFIFRYEDFIDGVEGVLGEICARLGISFDPMMLQYHQDKRTWFGASPTPIVEAPSPTDHLSFRNWQIKQPIMDRRGQWKTQLNKAEIMEIQSASRNLMEYFGYALAELVD